MTNKSRSKCRKKWVYYSREEARRHCVGLKLKAYRCPECGNFHLTKRKKITVVKEVEDVWPEVLG
jgi:hypothetical protein